MKKTLYILLGIALLQACIKKDDAVLPGQQTGSRSLAQILQNNTSFSMFYNAMEHAGLDSMITGNNKYTLLVPGNDVFQAAGYAPDSLQHMDAGILRTYLQNMILRGSISSDSVPQTINYIYHNLNGDSLYFSVPVPGPYQLQAPSINGNAVLHINGATAVRSNILASNGVIHSMDHIIKAPAPSMQAFLAGNPRYTWFVRAMKHFGLWDSLDVNGPMVLVAPTNDAYGKHGMDSLAVEALDTVQYKKWLVGNAIIHTGVFFTTDFKDAPMLSGFYGPAANPPIIITNDYMLVFLSGQVGITPFNYFDILNYPTDPWWGNPYQYGDQATFDDPDHICRNGIVQGTNELMALPEYLHK
ncbi:hypothetical protein DCC81_08095 [Chitinophaga parva]|uniref:FAS1 domain-containing protein n=1 Tax=Chitinophaga parva TaxID=2169414 RepID=A0A2T7BNZ1_9BACT|nr:fasciclin domain-containing protein [Chitinophaga parva]PUZ29397.1 hypothetical protein DCC81_08095 [Chitinophaga parva]